MYWKKGLFVLLFIVTSCALHAVGLDDAKGYNKNSSLQWQWAIDAIEKYPWNGNEKVLDLGCGDGKISAFISKQCSKAPVVGLDISPKMIGFASSVFHSDKFSNLLFQEGDIAQLPFHGQFDLAVAFCSLHYVVEHEKALKSIHEALTPGGHLLFVGPGRDNTSVANISEELIKTTKWAEHFPSFTKQRVYFTKEEYTSHLRNSGFEPVYFEVTLDKVKFANKAALIDWLRPFVNYISHLSDSLKEEFLGDLASIMMQSAFPSEDESIHLESTLFECLCSRVNLK